MIFLNVYCQNDRYDNCLAAPPKIIEHECTAADTIDRLEKTTKNDGGGLLSLLINRLHDDSVNDRLKHFRIFRLLHTGGKNSSLRLHDGGRLYVYEYN